MKLNITNIILLAFIVLFAWLWLSNPTETHIIPNNDKTLLKELKTAEYKLMQADTVIDSLTNEIIKADKARHQIESRFKSMLYAYEKQIKDIISNPIDSDIKLFRAEFAKSKSDKR